MPENELTETVPAQKLSLKQKIAIAGIALLTGGALTTMLVLRARQNSLNVAALDVALDAAEATI